MLRRDPGVRAPNYRKPLRLRRCSRRNRNRRSWNGRACAWWTANSPICPGLRSARRGKVEMSYPQQSRNVLFWEGCWKGKRGKREKGKREKGKRGKGDRRIFHSWPPYPRLANNSPCRPAHCARGLCREPGLLLAKSGHRIDGGGAARGHQAGQERDDCEHSRSANRGRRIMWANAIEQLFEPACCGKCAQHSDGGTGDDQPCGVAEDGA